MPIYGYRCQSCTNEFELLQRMSDPAGAPCPDCGGAGKRLFYPAGILFKGSGFYKTDSRSTAAATAASTADKSGSSDGAATKSSDSATSSPTTPSTAKPSSGTPSSSPAPAAPAKSD